jgi:hypothetical protein
MVDNKIYPYFKFYVIGMKCGCEAFDPFSSPLLGVGNHNTFILAATWHPKQLQRGYTCDTGRATGTDSECLQLQKEYLAMQRDPPPFVWAAPEERDILVCKCSPMRHLRDSNCQATGNYIIVSSRLSEGAGVVNATHSEDHPTVRMTEENTTA